MRGLLGGLFEPGFYTPEQVGQLLGFREGWSDTGARHVTALDILSWACDPGGGIRLTLLARLEADPFGAWMGQRGPLPPDSFAACVLYDLERAMARLNVLEHAVLGLSILGFSDEEIAAVIDPDSVLPLDKEHLRHHNEATRRLEARRKRIARMLYGRPKRGARGAGSVRDENGDLVHVGGLASKVARYMNEPSPRRSDAV